MGSRLVALTIGVAMLSSQLAGVTAAAAVPDASTPSDRYCNAFVDYYTVSFVAEFAAALAGAFRDTGQNGSQKKKKQPSPDEIRSIFLLVFSPKLERVTGVMATSGERDLRPVWRGQRVVFARGKVLLADAGLTGKQIEALANARIDASNAELDKLVGKVHISQQKLTALAKQFQRQLSTLDRTRSVSGAATAYARVGSECGAFPSTIVDCAKVLPESEASSILGSTVTQDGKKCAYKAPEPASGLAPKVAVELYDSARAYDKLAKSVKGQAVQGIGDRAVAHDGYSAYSNTSTCGRTLTVAAGQRTIAVALCLANDATVTDVQLVAIASGVLARLG